MKSDKHDCHHDLEQEQIWEAERQAHLNGLCNPVTCIYHIEDRERAEESFGG